VAEVFHGVSGMTRCRLGSHDRRPLWTRRRQRGAPRANQRANFGKNHAFASLARKLLKAPSRRETGSRSAE